MALPNYNKLVIGDTETTGFKENRIVSIAILVYENGKKIADKYILVNPQTQIESGASKVNGITVSSETISVDTSNVLGSFNGTPVSFTRKYGQGIENEWRASISQLTPATDKISISCTSQFLF